jgi:inner membrane protein
MEITGHFSNISFSDWNISKEDILYHDAYIVSGISDLRGIKDNIVLEWNNTRHEFNAGVALINSGIKARVPVGEETYKFKYDLKLNGSQSIYFIPAGKETVVEVQSSWKDPAFVGGFLPESYHIGDNGFAARWKVLHFNRNFPQRWLSTEPYDLDESSAFGVNLLLPVDHYQKNYRSAKYAVLIISLTFLIFFFIEVLNRKRIHPFQYILVGIALCVFYTLLLSFSEHLGFEISYLISAVAIIGLISIYLIGVLKSYWSSAIAASFLSLLYLFIFIILQLQDFALLAGSIGLFAALAVVMILSRNINWYEPGAEMVKEKV